jgi:putative MFS transporter
MSAIGKRVASVPITLLHLGAAALCAVGFGLDLMEITVNNALSAVFSTPPNAMSPTGLSWLLASVYIGAVLGAPALGSLADRLGIQRILTGALLWLGLTSLLVAARSDPIWVGCFRLLAGVALGAYPPLMVAYLTTITPNHYRGLLLFWVCGLAYLAPPLALFLIRWLTPIRPLGIDGWRWPFALGGLAAIVVGAAFRSLPEASCWLDARGKSSFAAKTSCSFERSRPVRLLNRIVSQTLVDDESTAFSEAADVAGRRRFAPPFAFVAVLYFLQPWAMAAFPLLTGPMLLRRGYDLNDTLLYLAVATFGPALSALATGFWIDRIPRRSSLIACCVVLLAAMTAFFMSTQSWLLVASVLAFAAGVAVYTPIMTMYGAEILSIPVRASSTAIAWSGNRLAAVLVPLLILPLVARMGPIALWLEVGSVLLVTMALIALHSPAGAALRRAFTGGGHGWRRGPHRREPIQFI